MRKEIPILFSTPMVQAILEGRKTKTRRTVKDNGVINCLDTLESNSPDWLRENKTFNGQEQFCPYGKPGDLLWVRETWCRTVVEDEYEPGYLYKADEDPSGIIPGFKWKPSIHMPKAAARIWLEVVSVRVERLQHICELDAINEGVEVVSTDDQALSRTGIDYKNYFTGTIVPNARKSFESLWFKINGAASWHDNPWVWVVEFKKVVKPQHK